MTSREARELAGRVSDTRFWGDVIGIREAAEILEVGETRARLICKGKSWCEIVAGRYVISRAGVTAYAKVRLRKAGRPGKEVDDE